MPVWPIRASVRSGFRPSRVDRRMLPGSPATAVSSTMPPQGPPFGRKRMSAEKEDDRDHNAGHHIGERAQQDIARDRRPARPATGRAWPRPASPASGPRRKARDQRAGKKNSSMATSTRPAGRTGAVRSRKARRRSGRRTRCPTAEAGNAEDAEARGFELDEQTEQPIRRARRA
jgi:hypothetical protein